MIVGYNIKGFRDKGWNVMHKEKLVVIQKVLSLSFFFFFFPWEIVVERLKNGSLVREKRKGKEEFLAPRFKPHFLPFSMDHKKET